MNIPCDTKLLFKFNYKITNTGSVIHKVISLGGKIHLQTARHQKNFAQNQQQQQQQQQQTYQQSQNNLQPPKFIDQNYTDQIILEEGSSNWGNDNNQYVEDVFQNQDDQVQDTYYQYTNSGFQDEQNQIEDQIHVQSSELQHRYEYPLKLIQYEDPPEYESVKAWFSAYLGVKYENIPNLYGANLYIPLPKDFVVDDFSRYELESKSSLFMHTMGASPLDLQRFVYKCPEIYCLPNRVLKERLSYLLHDLEIKPKRLVAYPQLLAMKPQQIVENMKRIAFIFKVPLKFVEKAMRQGCRIVMYSDDKSKRIVQWLFENNYPVKKSAQKILQHAPGTLLLGPKRIDQLIAFLKIWGLQREEIKRLILQAPEIITRKFSSRESVQKFVFLEHIVGYSISRIMYDCPQMAFYPLETHVAPRYYYAVQRGYRLQKQWITQLWRSSDTFFVKIPYIKKNNKESYDQFFKEWRMYDWPRIEQELEPKVEEYFQKYGDYIKSFQNQTEPDKMF